MSVAVIFFCDAKDCEEQHINPNVSFTEAGMSAAEEGWLLQLEDDGGTAFCPKHSAWIKLQTHQPL